MNILILNWRDIKNPHAGGAEQITQKYAEYWIKKGHKVFWVSNQFKNSKKEEFINGIKVKRIGPVLSRSTIKNSFFYPIFLLQSIFYAMNISSKEEINIVVDEIHGLPFFTPIYIRKRKVLLVCEVAGEIWDKMWPFPINLIGKLLERLIYYIYGNTEMWAISQNTKDDILKLNSTAKVKILPLGIDIVKRKRSPKTKIPSAVFLARLVPMKGIEIALDAASQIVQKLPDFKLFIIGRGTEEYETYLKKKVKQLKLERVVEFLGYVSEEEKYRYLSQSHFLFHPSYKEGFGLTVLEAGLVGTPAIVKKGSSLDELVTSGKDGFIIESSNEIAKQFIKSENKLVSLEKTSEQKAKSYSWDKKLKESGKITLLR